MFLEFITWLVEVALMYVIPLAASLRVLNNPSADPLLQKRWLIHWVLVVVIQFTVYPVINFLPYGYFTILIRLAVTLGLLFIHKILGNKISDLNDQFLTASTSLLDTLREAIKAQLIKYDLVKTQ